MGTEAVHPADALKLTSIKIAVPWSRNMPPITLGRPP